MATTVGLIAATVIVPTPAWAEDIRQQQWYLDALNIPAAQRVATGAGVIVAVIDTGVDTTHPDLQGQVVPGKCFSSGADDYDAKIDLDGHGTAMAGLIAAKGGGDGHALGVAPGAKVLPICISIADSDAYATFRETAQGIRYAVDHGSTVVSISFGVNADTYPKLVDDPEMVGAVRYALAHNVVIVAGVGNIAGGASSVSVPAKIPGVVAVTGTDQGGTFWPGSAQGPQTAIAAPATGVVSTDSRQKTEKPRTGDYTAPADGTSSATAIVSGVVALVRSKYPKLDAANVINRLTDTATHMGPTGRNSQYGFGIVNPVQALTASVPTVSINPVGNPPPIASSGAGTSEPGAKPGTGSDGKVLLWAWLGVGLAAILLAVILLIRWSRRRRRASARPLSNDQRRQDRELQSPGPSSVTRD